MYVKKLCDLDIAIPRKARFAPPGIIVDLAALDSVELEHQGYKLLSPGNTPPVLDDKERGRRAVNKAAEEAVEEYAKNNPRSDLELMKGTILTVAESQDEVTSPPILGFNILSGPMPGPMPNLRHYDRTTEDLGMEIQSYGICRDPTKIDGVSAGKVSPWVSVYDPEKCTGGLYGSVTITGTSSWVPLVKALHKHYPKKPIVIYSGRHGNLPNSFEKVIVSKSVGDADHDEKKRTLFVFDQKHMVQDNDLKTKLENDSSFKKTLDITIRDTGNLWGEFPQHRRYGIDTTIEQEEYLREAYKEDIMAGKIVILAWCYSLFTFRYVDDAATPRKIGEQENTAYLKVQTSAKLETVRESVSTYFYEVDRRDFEFADLMITEEAKAIDNETDEAKTMRQTEIRRRRTTAMTGEDVISRRRRLRGSSRLLKASSRNPTSRRLEQSMHELFDN